jgi:putative ABC transport system substrate-binding protein
LGIALVFMNASCSRPRDNAPKAARIGLIYIGPHELINQIVGGFKDGVAQSMGSRPYEIVERHANGDKTQVSTTVNAAIASRLDVIATITTPVSQVALKNAPATLPVVFVGVTDPVGAGLAKSMERPELSTGVSDLAPLAAMLALIKEVTPQVKRIGFPFSPEEQPAVYSRQTVEKLAPGLGLTIDARPVTSNDELATVVRELARSNDALLVGADNGMFEAAPTISKIALDNHKPFFAADSSSVKAGAAAGVTIDYKQVGLEGGKLAVRVLSGERAGSIPVTLMTNGVIELNRSTIKKLGLPFGEDVWKRAKTVYE